MKELISDLKHTIENELYKGNFRIKSVNKTFNFNQPYIGTVDIIIDNYTFRVSVGSPTASHPYFILHDFPFAHDLVNKETILKQFYKKLDIKY